MVEVKVIHFWLWPASVQPMEGFDWRTACGLPGSQALHSAYWDKVTCPECLKKRPQES